MQPIAASADRATGVAFLRRVLWLLAEVEELNRQLERIEAQMQQVLGEVARERVEEHR